MVSDGDLAVVQGVYEATTRTRRDLVITDELVGDLELDSVTIVEVLVALEQAFEVDLLSAPDELLTVVTVGDLLDHIATRQGR